MDERGRDHHVLRRAATIEDPSGMRVLLAAEPYPRISAARVARLLAEGLERRGIAAPELLELPDETHRERLAALLAHAPGQGQLHRSRALLVAVREAPARPLAGSALFELATRARQGGIPAYVVAAECSLGAFDARMLDLQLVLAAATPHALLAAGERLGELLAPAQAISAGSPGTRR